MNIQKIMLSPSMQEGFLKDASELRKLFGTTGWKVYLAHYEDLLANARADIEKTTNFEAGAIGKKLGTVLALKQALKFEEVINNVVTKIEASNKDRPDEEKSDSENS